MRVTRNRNKSKRKSTLKLPPSPSHLLSSLPPPPPLHCCSALLHLHLQHAVKCCQARDGHTPHKTITKDTSSRAAGGAGRGEGGGRGRGSVLAAASYVLQYSLCHFSLSNNNRTKSKGEGRRQRRKRECLPNGSTCCCCCCCTFMVYLELPTTAVDKLQQLHSSLSLSLSHSETIITIH